MTNTALNEIYAKEIVVRIYEDNAYLNVLQNYSQYLVGKTVHIPNQFTWNPSVSINGTITTYDNFTQTEEAFQNFSINNYRLQPILVENFDELVTSYPKFQMTTQQSIMNILDVISKSASQALCEDVIVANAATSINRIQYTSGATGTNNGYGGASNYKKFTYDDILYLKSLYDEDNLAEEGRWLIIDPIMYRELLQDPQIIQTDRWSFQDPIAPTAKVRVVAGFNILMKPTIATAGAASTSGTQIDPFNYVYGVDSAKIGFRRVALSFHESVPVLAMSSPRIYSAVDQPNMYGSTVSSEVNFGVVNPRIDGKGVYLVIQGE